MKIGNQEMIACYLSPEKAKRLEMLAKATNKRKTEYLREAVDDLLQKYEHVIPAKLRIREIVKPVFVYPADWKKKRKD
jgi:predicted DNA-binding protein